MSYSSMDQLPKRKKAFFVGEMQRGVAIYGVERLDKIKARSNTHSVSTRFVSASISSRLHVLLVLITTSYPAQQAIC